MFEIYALTDVGRVREHNEDGFLVNDRVAKSGGYSLSAEQSPLLFAVADGMGGTNAGEVASEMTLGSLKKLPLPCTPEDLQQAVSDIHQEVYRFGETHPEAKGLGTTLTGFFCAGETITTFHVGDSRLYRFRMGILRQITRDQSLVQSLFDMGRITREEMATHSKRHVLLQCIGGLTEQPPQVEVQSLALDPRGDDVYLLCSDGLSDMLSDEEMEIILDGAPSLEAAAHALVDAANNRGGHDNITVILMACK
ncbi:PP2C family protein-serine/threonine phosphatase [Brevibacillus dissolubilis]|uniref:PP2C family protein-serine/threonine phosphatase n=1 Tax=Brevibacillus dissolubilis TaxID=1844116 RepID=UPI0011177E49|nr:protein phosphatase 2C domain-containing protein [Brevibacillus dissolubilis]